METPDQTQESNRPFDEVIEGQDPVYVKKFFQILDELSRRVELSPNDDRVVFSCAVKNRMALIIGDRYCLTLDKKWQHSEIGFITVDRIEHDDITPDKFGDPRAFFNTTKNLALVDQYLEAFISACEKELKRTNKSRYITSNNPDFRKVVFEHEAREQLMASLPLTVETHDVEYFKAAELAVFRDRAGQSYDKFSAEDKEDFQDFTALYSKLEHWAKKAQSKAFPDGSFAIRKHPLNNNGSAFMQYLWARIYPSPELADKKWLGFTVSVDAPDYFEIKIDTIRIAEDNQLRRKYLDWSETTSIVEKISHEEALAHDWEWLINKAAQFMREKESALYDFYHQVSTGNSSKMTKSKERTALNQILYGPPGTGKTYSTKSLALQILDGHLPTNRKAINQRYQELQLENRIQFVTFHQSTTYEDFVEGIKPVMGSEEEESDLSYQIEDGIFKQLCILASYEYIKVQRQEQAAVKTLTFNQLYDQVLNDIQQRLEEQGEDVTIPLKSGHEIQVTEISKRGNFILQHKEGQRSYTVSRERTEKLYNEIEDIEAIPNIYSYFRSIIGGSNASAYWAILNQLFQQQESGQEIPEEKAVSYEVKKQAYERMNWEETVLSDSIPNYLLIIDEINRGNVAAIFGELITLLESDKRGGCSEYLKATLPYSKKGLVVPPNLYIIGTMNTADRSVEALDSALRRRFSFVEVAPKSELLSTRNCIRQLWQAYTHVHWDDAGFRPVADRLYKFLGVSAEHLEKGKFDLDHQYKLEDIPVVSPDNAMGVDLESLLSTINQRIEILLDKDHSIGHAYFMEIAVANDPWEKLREVFSQKILPLLQEYFFGDISKIQLILGSAFCYREESTSTQFARTADADNDSSDYLSQSIYRISDIDHMPMTEFQDAIRQITA